MESSLTIKGYCLRPNQTVGIIAPASPLDESKIREGLHLIESFPLAVRPGRHLSNQLGYLAGTDSDRVSDLHEMFADPDIKAILCARGGYGSARLLDGIDFSLIRDNPKIIVGFSDLTALLMGLFTHCGLIVIHGPTLADLSENNNWLHLSRLITTPHKPRVSLKDGEIITHGKARGMLLGGNMSTVCSLLDTPFLPSFEGAILFLEEKGESPYRLDRMLTQLLLSGRLHQISALIMGQLVDCGEKEVLSLLLRERLSGLAIPVATGLPVGHGRENVALPLGIPAHIDTERMILEILEPAVT